MCVCVCVRACVHVRVCVTDMSVCAADYCGESLRSVDLSSQYSFTPAGLGYLFTKSNGLRAMRLSLHTAVVSGQPTTPHQDALDIVP